MFSCAAKSFFVLLNRENRDGDMEAYPIQMTVTSDDKLTQLRFEHGGGSLVKENDPSKAVRFDDIEDGATYELIGGQQEAVKRHRIWTQVSDKVLEVEATKAVLADDTYGPLEEFNDYGEEPKVLFTKDGAKKEFDGLVVNGTTAVAVEAKHRAESKHIDIVKEKAEHVKLVASEGRIPRLQGMTSFIPVLAANSFSAKVRRACEEAGVGVVEPNGGRLSFVHKPARSPPSTSQS